MTKKVLISLTILSLYSTLFVVSFSIAAEHRLPSPDDYLVAEQFQGVPAPVDLKSHPQAPQFKTRLREGTKTGPNFAGHYTIVTWGCGSSCLSLALVNALSGQVIFPEEVSPIFFVGKPQSTRQIVEYDVIYSKKSSLLIIHGIPAKKVKVGSYYFNFKDDRFELVEEIEWESEFNKEQSIK